MTTADRLHAFAHGPLLGAAYYNEYLPDPSRLREDMRLMVEAGIGVIRVGESVWSTWEPRDGEFDLDWLAPVLDEAHGSGIRVILGTPTYAVPPWLSRRHPELAVVRANGRRVPWGGRQEVDYSSPVFRFYAERVIRAVLGRYGEHPAVIGVQLDNEAGLHLIHNDHLLARFRRQLEDRYGDVETLNRRWGLTYWSHRIGRWDELWDPSGNTTPAYDLAWRRFQAEVTAEYIAWQADLARELVGEEVFLTTCIAYGRPAMDDVAVGRHLDIASGNAYYLAQDALDARADRAGGGWAADTVAEFVLMADRMRATKEAPYLVTETGAASIGPAWMTRPPYDGQLAQAAWLLVARGARLVSYWHWHTLHSGHEVHWGGILGHDLEPGRIYGEVAAIGASFAKASDALAEAVPDADVGLVYAHDSEWMMAFEPPLPAAEGGDRGSYARIVSAFGRGALDAGRQVGFLNERCLPDARELLARYPTVIVPGLVAAADRTLRTLADYAELGGNLIIGPRTGFSDDEGRVRSERAPAVLGALAGVHYQEFSALAEPVTIEMDGVAGEASGWMDALIADDAEVVARYRHPHFGRWPAVTRSRVGNGSVTVVGTILDRDTMRRVTAVAAGRSPIDSLLDQTPREVTAHSLTTPRGRVWVVHNWSPEVVAVTPVRAVSAVIDKASFSAGVTVALCPWDVRVWREDGTSADLGNRSTGGTVEGR